MPTFHPTTSTELCELVQRGGRLRAIGGGTKRALSSAPEEWAHLDVSAFAGVVQYEPSEFTITVGAATGLVEIRDCLAANGQFMPFDPPLIDQGATIGGTIAAGLSGSGFFRFGTVRDFVLQVRMVDGLGNMVTGGSKVVKNAAGFDLPKLLVGSLGRLGIITEVTMKVFPQPVFRRTIEIETADFAVAFSLQNALARSNLGLEAIDLSPPTKLFVRSCGTSESTHQVATKVDSICKNFEATMLDQDDCLSPWQLLQDWSWIKQRERLVKIPLSPRSQCQLERLLHEQRAPRRYAGAGNVTWVRWDHARPIRTLEDVLRELGLSGLVLTGEAPRARLGMERYNTFGERVKKALDPHGTFGSLR